MRKISLFPAANSGNESKPEPKITIIDSKEPPPVTPIFNVSYACVKFDASKFNDEEMFNKIKKMTLAKRRLDIRELRKQYEKLKELEWKKNS